MPMLSGFVPLLKSRFFSFYVNGVTLANRMGRRDQGPALHSFIEHRCRAGVYSHRKLCYNTPNESEDFV